MSLPDRRFFVSTTHEWSYLPDRLAAAVVADPSMTLDADTYSRLLEFGFRRSGSLAYRPHCGSCQACVPIRIDAAAFLPSRGQRRTLKRNADLRIISKACAFDVEHYDLYRRYQNARHSGSSMDVDDPDRYIQFFSADGLETRLVEFRDGDTLLCVAVVDWLPDALSALYTFYDPEAGARGLGSYAILWQIMRARDLGLAHVYLGYWIRDCAKMVYKAQYRPHELFINQRWYRAR